MSVPLLYALYLLLIICAASDEGGKISSPHLSAEFHQLLWEQQISTECSGLIPRRRTSVFLIPGALLMLSSKLE